MVPPLIVAWARWSMAGGAENLRECLEYMDRWLVLCWWQVELMAWDELKALPANYWVPYH